MLGFKIRTRRKELGMNMKELADQVQLTAGFLSQIERGLAEPSISSLKKISKVLGVSMIYFFSEDDMKNPVVRKNERRQLPKQPGSAVAFESLTPDDEHQMGAALGRMDGFQESWNVPNAHPGEELIYIMQGTMNIQIGDNEYHLEEGDSIYFQSAEPHRMENPNEQELVFLSLYTPAVFQHFQIGSDESLKNTF